MTDIRFTSRSPVFVAHFADGETTRMTVCTTLDKLDVGCGVRLSRHAYSSRTGLPRSSKRASRPQAAARS